MGLMLRKPGGVAGAPPAAEGQAGVLTGGQADCAAVIHGGCASAAAGGHCASKGAAATQSEPAAQFH